MMKQFKVIDSNGLTKTIGIDPLDVRLVEGISKNLCLVCYEIIDKEVVYKVKKSAEEMISIVNLAEFNIMDN